MSFEPTPEQRAALQRFREKNGRNWKAALVRHWVQGSDDRQPDGALLRQIRNNIGGLDGLQRLRLEP